jgi:hypothetical protein
MRSASPVEPAELGPQVAGGDLEDLPRSPDRVVETDAFVPHGVPDGVGHDADVAPAFVHEHHVEIAARTELAPAVAAHGHQPESA